MMEAARRFQAGTERARQFQIGTDVVRQLQAGMRSSVVPGWDGGGRRLLAETDGSRRLNIGMVIARSSGLERVELTDLKLRSMALGDMILDYEGQESEGARQRALARTRVAWSQLPMVGHGSGSRIQRFDRAYRFQAETGELFVTITFDFFTAFDSQRFQALTGNLNFI